VALSFRDFGYKFLASWTDPFTTAFQKDSSRAQVVKVSITERSSLYVLQWFLTSIMKRNTPVEEHDKTLVYFGPSNAMDEFRDVLRLHNLMTGYVFLLDDLGRIRFAGSGPASDEEVARVIEFAKELSPAITTTTPATTHQKGFGGRHPGRRVGSSSGARTKKRQRP
jgi:mitochondrial ATPase complex subunit ATP10